MKHSANQHQLHDNLKFTSSFSIPLGQHLEFFLGQIENLVNEALELGLSNSATHLLEIADKLESKGLEYMSPKELIRIKTAVTSEKSVYGKAGGRKKVIDSVDDCFFRENANEFDLYFRGLLGLQFVCIDYGHMSLCLDIVDLVDTYEEMAKNIKSI